MTATERKIEEAIKKNKEERRIKYSNRSTFTKGHKVLPNAGRKKGSKTDVQKVARKHWKKEFEYIWASLLTSLKDVDFTTLTASEKLKYFTAMARFNMAEMQSIDVNQTQVKKIEVSFSDEFDNKVIDITPVEVKNIDNESGKYE